MKKTWVPVGLSVLVVAAIFSREGDTVLLIVSRLIPGAFPLA